VERSIIFAGFGGQGILFAGKVLARAAMNEEREVLWIPSYGPEMRGGTASCTVIVGDVPIGSPVVERADAAVVLNPPSHARFADRVAPGGLLVVNETLVSEHADRADIVELRIPCTRLARDAGDDSLVSVVALGALVGYLRLVRPTSIRNAIRETIGTKRLEVLDADLAAFDVGHRVGARRLATGASRLAPVTVPT
jgi:2-oxoglutarate ferredoxin oxidoreductase subunit gamma